MFSYPFPHLFPTYLFKKFFVHLHCDSNLKTKININGKEYSNPEEMPPDIRQIYEQAIAKGLVPTPGNPGQRIIVNGQSYNSPEEMPEDVRRAYDSAMVEMDKNQDGIPDAFQSGTPAGTVFPVTPPPPQSATIEPVNSTDKRLLVTLIVAGLLVLLAVAALALVMARR